jgi:dolichyl-phosphate-mannose-protein mannosyltransferase
VTTATGALRGGATRARVGVSADVLALGGLVLVLGVLAVLTWGTWGDLDSDTGYDLIAGARLADGDLPYRDFTYYYGPLAPALAGLAALVGGTGIGPAVVLGFLIAIAIVGATYALARSFVSPLGAFLAAAITAGVAFTPNNYSYVLPHTYGATAGTLLLLVLLLCLARFARSERPAWLAGAGVSVGLVALTKPEVAAAALAASAAWLLLSRSRREAVLLLVPAVAIPAAVYGFFAATVGLGDLLFENLWPRDELAAGGDEMLRARMPMTLESFAKVGGRFLLYAAGAAALVWYARQLDRGGRRRRWLLAGGVLAAVLVALVCAAKPDGLRDAFYYAWGWIPIGAAVAVAYLVYRRRGRLELAAAVALAVVAATTYAFTLHGWRPQMSVYYAPLAAILVVRLHTVELARTRTAYVVGAVWVAFLAAGGAYLALDEAGRDRVTVHGPGGSLAEAPAEAALYQRALDEIAARTEPGDKIFVTPLMTGLYVLSGHDSPLRQISSLPTALPEPADERDAIARLDAAPVNLVITDSRSWKGYGHTTFGDSFQRDVAAWVERNFERATTIQGAEGRRLEVWVR